MADEVPGSEQGRRLGKYAILTRLSVGGMAEVFLAYATGPGGFRKFVTLKRILPDVQEDESFVAMFIDEARISAALSHSNIAQVFDLGEEAGELYIAMEFIPGHDLRQLARASTKRGIQVPIGFGCMVIRDACSALHYAHNFTDAAGNPSPIIHRDVSPKNIMVTYQGTVKVIDFGIAKAMGTLGRTVAGTVKGTTAYMSPEQIRGEGLDGRSDLFSAGIVLHELLTGQQLFNAPSDLETMEMILAGKVRSPRELNPNVPEAVSEVVMRALSLERESRFESGRQMAKAIESAAGPLLFDEDRATEVMRTLFQEQMEKTRTLLTLGVQSDDERLRAAAGALTDKTHTPGTATGARPSLREDATMRLASRPATPQPGSLPPPVAAPAQPVNATILVVDDSRTGVAHVTTFLKKAGYRVIGCTSPSDALEKVDQERIDLVVLDVVMPGLDGFQLCQMIREKTAARPPAILFLSAACSLEERVKGLAVGGDDFIRKPFDSTEFIARVRMQLARIAMLRGDSRPRV